MGEETIMKYEIFTQSRAFEYYLDMKHIHNQIFKKAIEMENNTVKVFRVESNKVYNDMIDIKVVKWLVEKHKIEYKVVIL